MASETQSRPGPSSPRSISGGLSIPVMSRWPMARSPGAGAGHAGPGRLGCQRFALLQELDGDPVGGAHEGHLTVPGRPVDGDPRSCETIADRIDVVHGEGQMAEIAS